jgi:hypothetical protein
MWETQPVFRAQTSGFFLGGGFTYQIFSVVSGPVPEKRKFFLSNPTEEVRPPCFHPKTQKKKKMKYCFIFCKLDKGQISGCQIILSLPEFMLLIV